MRRFLVASAVAALTLAGGLTVDAHTGVAPHLTYTHTPSGKMRSDCVHQLASGHTVAESTGEGWMDVMDAEGNYVRTLPKCANQASFPLFDPSTPNRHARQQQQQQPAKTILTEEEFRATKPKQDDPFPPDYDGWEAYTAWHYPSGITLFNGNFSVPDTPASQPDVLYLFTGLQNVDWIPVRDPEVPGFDIIQPVLQYPADGSAPLPQR
jgi:hypothetical protein